jgi:hypothetical protein
MDPLIGALATLVADHEDAAAFEMARAGIHALIRKHPDDRKVAQTWHAVSVGCDPNQDAIAIVDLAEEVERTAVLFTASNPPFSPTGTAAIATFRLQYLVERFGNGVPSEQMLMAWFSKHKDPHSSGGVTTAGIVARIVHHARLFGARGTDTERTRKRVDRVLARAHKLRK